VYRHLVAWEGVGEDTERSLSAWPVCIKYRRTPQEKKKSYLFFQGE
jgi:hypothetical protein